MKVFFDHQTFSIQKFGGISRYNVELISGVNKGINDTAYLPILLSDNVYLNKLNQYNVNLLPKNNFYKKAQIVYKINKLYSVAHLVKKGFDLFHPTYYDPYFLPYLKGKPFVLTIHDMIHERFVEQFPELDNKNSAIEKKQVLAEKADRIITVSNSTKLDVVNMLGVKPEKVHVIYSAGSFNPVWTTTKGRFVEEPYLLFVGRRERYKNFEGLLNAIRHILEKYKIKLVCAGGGEFTAQENKIIDSFRLSQLVNQISINDKLLSILYNQAIAFIFPSLYEGFGIPVLEAFASDCPCIVSNQSSLPEVGGDAVVYINPFSRESIVDAVEKIICSSQLRQDLIEKGRVQLAKFSWDKTVKETVDLYRTLL
ncbi:glycosyltransferase involved in cell wall biosynthesis [Spirosoma oryzae]|uniref:Glycosyltransferase involved in cell wall biosynthesis n=1 Tax=Spirosoma oryzae TaxID=1469603 RepID=A0A2T0S1X0_9BACT|nr:glycosyltransferase family 1 protein [Spirosoma oryzae]PRY27412.1 glycosyltransferase involved in cell wall biosynthesis [Spirosoma oryzae]